MPLRYHRYLSGSRLWYDALDRVAYGFEDSSDSDEPWRYIKAFLPSLSLCKHLTEGEIMAHPDISGIISSDFTDRLGEARVETISDLFDKVVSHGRIDLAGHILMVYFEEFGDIDAFLRYANCHKNSEIVNWIESVGFRFKEITPPQLYCADIDAVEIILKLSDYTPKKLLDEFCRYLNLRVIGYLTDLCDGIGPEAYMSLIETWRRDKIALLYRRGYPITGKIIDYVKKHDRYLELVSLLSE